MGVLCNLRWSTSLLKCYLLDRKANCLIIASCKIMLHSPCNPYHHLSAEVFTYIIINQLPSTAISGINKIATSLCKGSFQCEFTAIKKYFFVLMSTSLNVCHNIWLGVAFWTPAWALQMFLGFYIFIVIGSLLTLLHDYNPGCAPDHNQHDFFIWKDVSHQ